MKGMKTGGRKKGSLNKTTGEVKEMVLEALSGVGGVEYLKGQAAQNPTAFLTLVGKVLPLQVTGKDGGPLEIGWALRPEEATEDPSRE